jgi:hypothetical protein
MAFSLLTKKGNKQQTKTVELPSDSTFAIAMKTQQAAEREEQQRIKSLVLNYDLMDKDDGADGEFPLTPWSPVKKIPGYGGIGTGDLKNGLSNMTIAGLEGKEERRYTHGHRHGGDKSANTRAAGRSRKLQLSDVDWYDGPSTTVSVVKARTPSSSPVPGRVHSRRQAQDHSQVPSHVRLRTPKPFASGRPAPKVQGVRPRSHNPQMPVKPEVKPRSAPNVLATNARTSIYGSGPGRRGGYGVPKPSQLRNASFLARQKATETAQKQEGPKLDLPPGTIGHLHSNMVFIADEPNMKVRVGDATT